MGRVRQLDIKFVAVGPSEAEQLRRVWLDMLAEAPGVYAETLDEALACGDADWVARAREFTRWGTAAFAAVDSHGRFVGFVSGYVDREGEERLGQVAFLHVVREPGAPTGDVAAALIARLSEWMRDHWVSNMFMSVREESRCADLLRNAGFVETGARRVDTLDEEFDEIEFVCPLWDPLSVEAMRSTVFALGVA